MKLRISLFLVTFFMIAGGTEAALSAPCVPAETFVTLQISALQQRFMVAALSCGPGAHKSYNHFQQVWKPVLQRSDNTMLHTFRHLFGPGGMKVYNAFKTRLAAKAELRRIQNHPLYCQKSARNFQTLENARDAPGPAGKILSHFASGHIDPTFSWPVTVCPATPVPHSGGITP